MEGERNPGVSDRAGVGKAAREEVLNEFGVVGLGQMSDGLAIEALGKKMVETRLIRPLTSHSYKE